MELKITKKQKNFLEAIYESITHSGFPPTLADLKNRFDLASNQSVLNNLDALEKKGLIRRKKEQARSINILPLGFKILNKNPLISVLGASSAGPFIEPLDKLTEWVTLRGKMVENEKIMQGKEDFFAVMVSGDSMINAEINDGDILLVKKTREYRSGDIVVARCDDGTTVKRFIAESDGRAYLKPENPVYKNIPIFEEMIFEGKVILNLSAINKIHEQ